jgi:hypothetical protein
MRLVQAARSMLGVDVHYRSRYQEYLQGPRWFLLRHLRLAIDGHRCTYTEYYNQRQRRCTAITDLQVHHPTYKNMGLRKNASGIAGMWSELMDLRTLCDAHHTKES